MLWRWRWRPAADLATESLRFMLGRDGKMSANLTDSHMKVVDRLLTDRLRDADMGANEEDSTFRSHGMLRFE